MHAYLSPITPHTSVYLQHVEYFRLKFHIVYTASHHHEQ